jgi:putative membrane protein
VKNSAYAVGAGLAALALASTATAPGAYAASDGDVDVVNTETVQVYVQPDGSIESQRVYEQLTLTGTGTTEIANPIEEEGLRNLNGFASPEVEDGVQNFEVDVDGVERLRSVSDYTGDLPLDISVEYRLDGELVEPGDVVGSDGELEVLYTARNITAQPQEVTFPDGQGGTVTETVDVPIPMVGSLTTVVPPTFTEVSSQQANMAGDGKGGTKLSFTMTLFPPIGSDTAEFGYTAKISDGVVPSSSVSALPVNPLQSPSFKAAGESYQAGSDTGVKLAEGAAEIDMNLLKLRDGAAKLLGGLIKLSDGADQLSTGLSGEAAPGARKLADGAGELDAGLGKIDEGAGKLAAGAQLARAGGGQLADGAGALNAGLGKIDDGAGQLADGADRLSGGTGDALAGSRKLRDGLQQISGGLDLLASDDKLPAALDGAKQLKAGIDEIVTKVGSASSPGTLLWGIDQLATKLPAAEAGSAQILGGLRVLKGEVPAQSPGLIGAKGGVDQVQAGLADAIKPGGSLDQLIGGLESLKGFCDADEPACVPTIDALKAGATTSKTNLTAANGGLLQVSAGLGNAIGALDSQLIPGATLLNAGLTEAKNGAALLNANGPALRAGLLQVQGGLGELVTGLTTAVAGVGQLSTGASDAYAGSGDLTSGLAKIDGGANELADGAGRLAGGTGDAEAGSQKLADGADALADGIVALSDGALKLAGGTGEAADGSGRLADGADELADGLLEAADGSVRLADGLAEAEDGAPALVDGAGRLSTEGMSKLIDAGEDTAQDYGKLYATIEAGAERADAEKMAYGAPADAQGLTAYTYEMLGDDGETGRNTKRGLAALGLLGLGGGALLLRRRLI